MQQSGIFLAEQSKPFRQWHSLLLSCSAIGAVLLLTWVDYKLLHVNSATAGFTFLLVVLGFAARVGLRESIIASLTSVLVYNFYFLPPIGTLTIAEPQNWVALFAFLATAVTASRLSSSARRKAEEAGAREEELQRMYNFSRALMLGDTDRSLPSHIAQQLSHSFGFETVAFYEAASDTVYQIGDEGEAVPAILLRRAAASRAAQRDDERGASVIPVLLGGHSFGSIAVKPAEMLSGVAMQAVAQLIAIALERARAQQTANTLEATRQNEQLKSTLLDALAHEFKTPLTSVKAATTTLLGREQRSSLQTELLTVIDEEADRMTNLVNDSIELGRIGRGAVTLHRDLCAIELLVSSALSELRPLLENRQVHVKIEPSLPPVDIDSKLSGLALRQVLGNALKYSPPGSPIRIQARKFDGQFVELAVANEGPMISESEQALLFDKFYRGKDARGSIPGTGLGLHITREIIQAQGGRIWMESKSGEDINFLFTFPTGDDSAVGQDFTTNGGS